MPDNLKEKFLKTEETRPNMIRDEVCRDKRNSEEETSDPSLALFACVGYICGGLFNTCCGDEDDNSESTCCGSESSCS